MPISSTSSRKSRSSQVNLIVATMYAILCIVFLLDSYGSTVHSYPTANANSFSLANKLSEKLIHNEGSQSDQSFHEFVSSQPESTYIGELKPNSSELEVMIFRNKVASAILSMQEMEKAQSARSMESTGGDCFIEVTRVERVAGKCHKVNNGLPICQSKNYMAINNDCN